MADIIQVQTTTETREQAQKIADHLVEHKLAACSQVSGPIHSTYRWEGKVTHTDEWVLAIKTEGRLFNRVEEAIKELHSYDMPEIITTIVDYGSQDYMNWVSDEVI